MVTDAVSNVWDKASKINKKLDSIEELYETNDQEIIAWVDKTLVEQQMAGEYGSAVTFLKQFSELREAISILSPIYPYVEAMLDTMKKYDVATKANTEYRDFLAYMSSAGAGHSLVAQQNIPFTAGLDDAAQFYQSTKNEVAGIYLEQAIKLFQAYVGNTLDDVYSSVGEILAKVAKEKGKDVVPYFAVLKGIGIGFDLLLPDLGKGFTEMRKMPVYADVAETMWQVSQALLQRDMTAENVAYICQSQMVSLILSKKCYSAFKNVNNGKLFFGDDAKNAIQTNQIDPIDKLLAELSLTNSCRVNDSVEGKDEAQTNIKTILQSVVETSSDAIEDTPSSSEETAPSEETSAESEVVEEPSKEESVPTAQEIEKLYRDFVAQNFSGNYVALKADVTHDGIADLIVVHYEDVEGWDGAYHQNGYIYTWQPSGIKLLKQEYGGTAHNYPGLLWYLRKLDNGMYNLIVIDDRIRQMTNFATISEISLTNDGAEITERAVEKFGTAQGEYVTDEELDAFWARENQINSEMIDTSPLNKNIDPAIVLCRGNT